MSSQQGVNGGSYQYHCFALIICLLMDGSFWEKDARYAVVAELGRAQESDRNQSV
jgi:hypothetical protein